MQLTVRSSKLSDTYFLQVFTCILLFFWPLSVNDVHIIENIGEPFDANTTSPDLLFGMRNVLVDYGQYIMYVCISLSLFTSSITLHEFFTFLFLEVLVLVLTVKQIYNCIILQNRRS